MHMRLIALALAALALSGTAALTSLTPEAVAQTKPLSDGPGGCERKKPEPTTT